MLLWPGVDGVNTKPSVSADRVERAFDAVDLSGVSTVGDQPVALPVAQSSGDVGGMLMAGVVLLGLGLAGVAAWRAGLSRLVPGQSEVGSTAVEPSSEPDSAGREGAADTEAETQAAQQSDSKSVERTDRERVTDILVANDGRMKQANIVDETGWSKSKVSMLLSEMEEDEEISKLRVGRENIISLSGNEPEAAGSPFDDE